MLISTATARRSAAIPFRLGMTAVACGSRVIGGSFKEDEYMKGNDFMRDGLVDEVGNEGGRGMADDLHAEPQ